MRSLKSFAWLTLSALFLLIAVDLAAGQLGILPGPLPKLPPWVLKKRACAVLCPTGLRPVPPVLPFPIPYDGVGTVGRMRGRMSGRAFIGPNGNIGGGLDIAGVPIDVGLGAAIGAGNGWTSGFGYGPNGGGRPGFARPDDGLGLGAGIGGGFSIGKLLGIRGGANIGVGIGARKKRTSLAQAQPAIAPKSEV